jgi:DNA-binding GntR family transcriptional regulator
MQLEQIEHPSLQEVAYERIQKALRSGAFKAGEALPTRTLAKALGISTTPVREALGRLVAQNVLAVDSVNGTPYVPAMTPELIREVYELRSVLEGMAAEHAARQIDATELAQLQQLWDRLSARNIDKEEQHRITGEFQLIVYRAARRPVLLDLIQSILLRSGLILGLLAKSRPAGGPEKRRREACSTSDARRCGRNTRYVAQSD